VVRLHFHNAPHPFAAHQQLVEQERGDGNRVALELAPLHGDTLTHVGEAMPAWPGA
jgi:hypothetical protein